MIKNNSIQFCVTCKYSKTGCLSTLFANLLEQSLIQMQAIVLSDPDHDEHVPKSLSFTHPTVTIDFHMPKKIIHAQLQTAQQTYHDL